MPGTQLNPIHGAEPNKPTPQANTSSPELSALLLPLIEKHRGDVGVVIQHFPSGESFAYQADKPMSTASLIKLPLLMATYAKVHDGGVSLDTMITLTEADKVPGSGILTKHFSPGLTLSLRDAIQLMVAYSDNTATNLVIDTVGLDTTNTLMKKLGCDETRLNSKVFRRDTSNDMERSKAFGLGSTSANDMQRMLRALHDRSFVDQATSEQILKHLYDCEDRMKAARYLPANVKVAHKGGSVNAARTDAGIIDLPDGKGAILFCVLTMNNQDESWTDDNEGDVLSAKIGKAVYDYFVKKE
ncbi:serine hydrolase [Bremerella cremea]|uniref:beta-lactamase n=1 Tax=Bremerella cremea TaxID=1031537 RepID=A0A368KK79_9BACT|nr:serine hydrolase [Bremerella cremea]